MNRQDETPDSPGRALRLELHTVQARLVREFIDAACAAGGRTLSSLVRRRVRRQLERLLQPLFRAYVETGCPPDAAFEQGARALLAAWDWPAEIAGRGTLTQAQYAAWRRARPR